MLSCHRERVFLRIVAVNFYYEARLRKINKMNGQATFFFRLTYSTTPTPRPAAAVTKIAGLLIIDELRPLLLGVFKPTVKGKVKLESWAW